MALSGRANRAGVRSPFVRGKATELKGRISDTLNTHEDLPFSMEHFPNLPSKQFAGKSRIGQYGDKLMESDYHVGQILDALKELGVDGNTLLVFASVNGPQGETAREMGNQGSPDMGNSGPFRATCRGLERQEGAILPHRRWLHLRSCRPSMTWRSGLGRSAAVSAYGK